MPVDTTHHQYDQFSKEWKRCRDAISGQSAIHDAGTEYLPRLTNQTDSDYKSYKERALFYEASGRTVVGFCGMVFRKNPIIDQNDMADFLEDVTLEGVDITGFAKDLTKETLEVGRAGILVDYPIVSSETENLTLADAERSNLRPFFKKYCAESIINWRCERINNKTQLAEVRLLEEISEQDPDDEFNFITQEQIRVLELNERGIYQHRIFRKIKNKKGMEEWVQMGDALIPLAMGSALNFIPFVFVGTDSTAPDVQPPPLSGLVNVNLSHYKNTADLEHGAHFTGLPTAVITGHTKGDEDVFRIGSTTAWVFSQPDANAKYLEFSGKGLDTLKEMLKEKENMMAALGAQMLTPTTRRNEAAETAQIRHMGENSILASISQTISAALNDALQFAALWLGTSSPATIKLNTDFLPTPMTPQMMRELLQAVQSGRISYRTYFENMKRGEIIDGEKSLEDEQAEIETEPPPQA